jgi:hypothetical protein
MICMLPLVALSARSSTSTNLADPWEMKNLYADARHADTIAAHRKLLAEWNARLRPVPPMPDVSRGRKARPQRRPTGPSPAAAR